MPGQIEPTHWVMSAAESSPVVTGFPSRLEMALRFDPILQRVGGSRLCNRSSALRCRQKKARDNASGPIEGNFGGGSGYAAAFAGTMEIVRCAS
jgi:hypothetical protein